jgi:hypothetical protein
MEWWLRVPMALRVAIIIVLAVAGLALVDAMQTQYP